jgi:hypothetical protein
MATIDAVPRPPRRRRLVSEGSRRRWGWVRCLPVWLAILSLTAPVLALDSKLARKYQNQQGKLRRHGNSVKKVKILIKMSAIDLEIVSRRVRTGLYVEADRILGRYVATVSRAEQVLKDSKRDPQRKPGGFKHLEISLRKQLRQLADLRDLYPFDRQQAIDRTIACAEAVKQRMIAALFGPDNAGRSGDGSAGVGPAGTAGDPSLCRPE